MTSHARREARKIKSKKRREERKRMVVENKQTAAVDRRSIGHGDPDWRSVGPTNSGRDSPKTESRPCPECRQMRPYYESVPIGALCNQCISKYGVVCDMLKSCKPCILGLESCACGWCAYPSCPNCEDVHKAALPHIVQVNGSKFHLLWDIGHMKDRYTKRVWPEIYDMIEQSFRRLVAERSLPAGNYVIHPHAMLGALPANNHRQELPGMGDGRTTHGLHAEEYSCFTVRACNDADCNNQDHRKFDYLIRGYMFALGRTPGLFIKLGTASIA